jgi:hypothetical protein
MTPRRRLSTALAAGLAGALALAALLAACSAGRERLDKPKRSALWVGPVQAVSFPDLSRLEQVGIGELFVEAAHLSWQGTDPHLETVPMQSLPRRTGVTLVVSGGWPHQELDPEKVAAALAADLAALRPQAEGLGLVPLGFHLDVAAGGSLASYAAVLAALQNQLDSGLFLSATVERAWVGDPDLQALADAVDFLVAFVYGQRPGEREDNGAWDLDKVEANLRSIDLLGRDYLVGVVTLGRVVQLGPGDEPLAETTRLSLGELVHHPALELTYGSVLEGVDRQSYRFRVRGASRVGEWKVAGGQSVRMSALASAHIEEFERRVGALPLDHHLGELYYRLAAPEERMSLSLANLIDALALQVATAMPQALVERRGGSAARPVYRVTVENASDEPTDVILLGSNYVELRTAGGVFGQVDPGDFGRWELLRPDRGGKLVRGFRDATILRLYVSYLEGRQRVVSGAIEVVGQGGEPTVTAGGEFVLPGGRTVAVEEVKPPAPEKEAAAPTGKPQRPRRPPPPPRGRPGRPGG